MMKCNLNYRASYDDYIKITTADLYVKDTCIPQATLPRNSVMILLKASSTGISSSLYYHHN